MADRKPHRRTPTARGSQATQGPSLSGSGRASSHDARKSDEPIARTPPFLDRSLLEARLPQIDLPAEDTKATSKAKPKGGPLASLKARRAARKKNAQPMPEAGPETKPEAEQGRAKRKRVGRGPLIAIVVVVGVVAVLAIAYAVLTNTSAFVIRSIDCESTEHVTAEDIATLAAVPEGTTLLNYDAAVIEENLKHNPWVGSVSVSREFPDRLRIDVTERTVTALVPLNGGTVVWCLGTDDVWIEPIKVVSEKEQTVVEATLALAREKDCLLITDVPVDVSPVAGMPAEGDVFSAITSYRYGLSANLWNQIVSFSAPSTEGLSCTLESGVEISLGNPTAISTKEAIIEQLLARYPNRLTYINVRVPSNPSYRMIDSDSVVEGTGVMGGYGPNEDAQQDEEGVALPVEVVDVVDAATEALEDARESEDGDAEAEGEPEEGQETTEPEGDFVAQLELGNLAPGGSQDAW